MKVKMTENQTCNWKIGRPMKIEKTTKKILNLNINWPFLVREGRNRKFIKGNFHK